MPLFQYKSFTPIIGEECFVAPSADIIGRVKLGDHVNLWFQTVVRGDVNEIIIGENTNIQDLSMLHVIDEVPLIIGKNVSVGHKVTLHACTIGDNSLIGMGATVLDEAVIGKNSLVAAGSVVTPRKKFPDYSLIMGSPARFIRELNEEERIRYGEHYKSYLSIKNEYLDKKLFKRI